MYQRQYQESMTITYLEIVKDHRSLVFITYGTTIAAYISTEASSGL
jgi:hypothetical protein